MFEVKTKQVEAQPYISKAGRVRVSDLEPFIVRTIGELSAEREPTGPAFTPLPR